ncbi:MAG TPA: hypothetical protein VGF53_11590 [Pseudolabrys sp.]|jgi:hypothetical protein
MKHIPQFALLAATLAAALAMPPARAGAFAGNDVEATDPGFVPNSGQINRGVDEKLPSISQARPIPTPAEARAALMMPGSDQPVLGGKSPEPMPTTESTSPKHDSARRESENASGGPETVDVDQTPASRSGQSTIGSASPPAASFGPIGATGQTMPAKFSQRNDVLDRVPTMAWPLVLSDEERQRIYQAAMADNAPAASDADRLAPASGLTANQALNEMHPLPASVSSIGAVQGLDYIKTKNKTFLVRPATRIVVDEIGS